MSIERLRRFCRLRTLMAYSILWLLPVALAAQDASDPSTLSPGFHRLTLPRADGPVINYAILVPDSYSPSTPVPLILALHFGGNPTGAGASVLQILIGPALSELGAIIVAPDSVGGNWTTPDHPRKRGRCERVARHGLGPLCNRRGKDCSYRLQHGRRRLLAFCAEFPGTLQRGNSYRRQTAGISRRVAASGIGYSFPRRPSCTF